MSKYNRIYGRRPVNIQAPEDFWTSALGSLEQNYDRIVAAQERKKADERYAEQQNIAREQRLEEQKRYNQQQDNIMFQQKYNLSIQEYERDKRDFDIALSQIGPERPDLRQKMINKFAEKSYKIPRPDGSFETKVLVPESIKDYTRMQVKTKSEFDDIRESWSELSNEQKILAWPLLKEHNQYFNRDLSFEEEEFNKAKSYIANEKFLNSMSGFLPETYSDEKFESLKAILLQDKEVSDEELKLLAGDISSHIANKEAARKFWSDKQNDIINALSKTKEFETPPDVIENLQKLFDIANKNLNEFYPGMSSSDVAGGGATTKRKLSEEEFAALANQFSKELWGKNVNEINKNQADEIETKISNLTQDEIDKFFPSEVKPIQSAFAKTKNSGLIEDEDKEKKLHEVRRSGLISRTGPPIKDPVTKNYVQPESMGIRVKNSPFTYANKGIIPSDEWPGFKEVSIKEALEHYQKNKSKYKKDKKITSKGFLWRDKEDLTQYPE